MAVDTYLFFMVPAFIGMLGSLLLLISTVGSWKTIQKWPRLIMLADFVYTTAVSAHCLTQLYRKITTGVSPSGSPPVPVWHCSARVYPHLLVWMPFVIATLHIVISIDRLMATAAAQHYYTTQGATAKKIGVGLFTIMSTIIMACFAVATHFAVNTKSMVRSACGLQAVGYKQTIHKYGIYVEVIIFITAIVASCIQLAVFIVFMKQRNRTIEAVGGLQYAKKQVRLTKSLMHISLSFLLLFTFPAGLAVYGELYKERHNMKGLFFQLAWFMMVLHTCSNWFVFLSRSSAERERAKAILCCRWAQLGGVGATSYKKSSTKNRVSAMKKSRVDQA